MKKELEKKLEGMVNKTFNYGGRIHCVLSYQLNGKLVVNTNDDNFERDLESAEEFLSYWKPYKVATQPVVAIEVPLSNEANMVNKLTDLLMDNIDKLKDNPAYIKQAQAINNNVNSIINLTKLKLDVIRESRKSRRSNKTDPE